MAGTSTRSPSARLVTAEPAAATVPTASWPKMRPSTTAGTSPLRMCRSVPQIVVVSIRTTISVGSAGAGSSTVSQDFWPGPWYTSAFNGASQAGEIIAVARSGHVNSGWRHGMTHCETNGGAASARRSPQARSRGSSDRRSQCLIGRARSAMTRPMIWAGQGCLPYLDGGPGVDVPCQQVNGRAGLLIPGRQRAAAEGAVQPGRRPAFDRLGRGVSDTVRVPDLRAGRTT